jgi:hyperosmotically inducible periplasmic protein
MERSIKASRRSRLNDQPVSSIMKSLLRLFLVTVASAAMAASFTGCGSPEVRRTAGEYIDDQTINARVKTALLRDDDVAGFDVSTTTFDGVVQLSGFVASEDQRQRAEDVVMGVDGVQMVLNNLAVNPRAQEFGAPGDRDREPQAETSR